MRTTTSLFCSLVYLMTMITDPRYAHTQQDTPEAVVRQRIAVLMSNTLREREKTASDGRKLWVPVPLTREALKELKGYGDKAEPILAEYLKSGSYHERIGPAVPEPSRRKPHNKSLTNGAAK